LRTDFCEALLSDKDFNIPASLIKALKAGEVVPFVGAGVPLAVKKKNEDGTKSKESLFPSWKEFLLNAAGKLDAEKISLNDEGKSRKAIIIRNLLDDEPIDYLDIAQRVFDALGRKNWYDLLKENFELDNESADKDSKKLAELIWQLGSSLIATTNVDLVLESAYEKPLNVKPLDTQAPRLAQLQTDWRPSNPTVLHLHGYIDNESHVVFTREQYKAFYDLENNRAKLETLRSLFTQRAILFIGFSLDDLHILKELERVNLIYEGGANRFYALIRESEKNNPNIPDYVQQINFSDFDKPLEDLVEELSRIAGESKSKEKDKSESDSPNEESEDKAAKKPFFNVPYNSKGREFVGRKGKLEEIRDLLGQDGCASIGQAVNVKGFGGLGKTQLAVEYAHEYRDEYKSGVFWLVADQPIDNQLLQIADRKGWINQFDKTVNQIDVAKAKFLELSDCLILFDNVETYADIKDYLPKLNKRTHALITSREKQPAFRQVDLELLGRDESRELLLKISNRNLPDEAEKEHLENILETLGDIPLAIELVGGYLAEHETVTFAKYHQFLDEVPLDKLEKEFPEGSFTNHDRSIIQTLRISKRTIEEKPLMVEILNVLAWSGSSSMGTSLLQALVEAESNFEFETALGDAFKLRLLKKDEGAERYAIHRLLAKVIRHEEPLEEQNEWHQKTVGNLESWFDERKEEFNYLAEFEAEIEHLNEWQNHTVKYLPKQSVWLTALESYPLWQRGNYQKSLQLLEKSFSLYEIGKVNNIELLAKIQNDLGVTYGELGNHQEALKYKEKALTLRKELFGDKHPATALSYNNVGDTYVQLGKHLEALEYNEKALKIYQELFGEKNSDTANSYNNVGLIYGELGKHQEALKYKEKSLMLLKDLLGEKHPDTANSYNNVGWTYRELGKYQEALKYQEKAVELQQELLGKQHPKTIVYVGNLITTYLKLGDKDKAGKKAAEFLGYVPQNNPNWKWFEEISRPYRPKKKRHSKRKH